MFFIFSYRDIRENFIRAKYELKAWIPREDSIPPDLLNKRLCEAVKTDDVITTLQLIVHGANVRLSIYLFVCLFVCLYT